MLLACAQCHRQYDVGDYPEGSRVRCLCGHLNTVPKARARRVEMLHCSNCGGRLAAGARRCEYCSSEVALADRGLGPACPECFATTLAGARHCSGCGVRLETQGVIRALLERPCPRCKQPLSESDSGQVRYVECTHCGGLWLDEALFEKLANERDRALATAIRGTLPAPQPVTVGRETVRYLPCPVCGEIMNRRNFATCSGVILDWCRGHGWWFDAQELGRVLAFLEQGGLERARRIEHERRVEVLRREKERAMPSPSLYVPPPRARNLVDQLIDFLLFS